MKVVRLSAILTGRLCPQEIFLVLISVKRPSRRQSNNAAGRIMSMKSCILKYYPEFCCWDWGKPRGASFKMAYFRAKILTRDFSSTKPNFRYSFSRFNDMLRHFLDRVADVLQRNALWLKGSHSSNPWQSPFWEYCAHEWSINMPIISASWLIVGCLLVRCAPRHGQCHISGTEFSEVCKTNTESWLCILLEKCRQMSIDRHEELSAKIYRYTLAW
jgi:hypothetical protein